MTFLLTKIPTVEDLICDAFTAYLKEIRWGEYQPNYKNVNISNDHPFEELLGNVNDNEPRPNLFPSVTIVASNDGEVPGMGKNWKVAVLDKGDIDGMDPHEWYTSYSALDDLKTVFLTKNQIFGMQHHTMWRDSASIEIWTENIQIKNELYNLALAFLQGPKILQLKQEHDIIIPSNSIQGQRSGYYNFDFGRVLYGGRIAFTADYKVLQAVYDSEKETLAEIEHSYREVIHG
jgi:hypothetical protein